MKKGALVTFRELEKIKLSKGEIKGKDVDMHLLQENEIEMLRIWRNDNREYFFNDNKISAESQIRWFRSYKENPNDLVFIVEKQSKPMGAISLYDINLKERTAEFGRMMVVEKQRRKGLAEDAARSILDLGFNKLRLLRIELGVIPKNIPAIKFYEKLGFNVFVSNQQEVRMFMERGAQ